MEPKPVDNLIDSMESLVGHDWLDQQSPEFQFAHALLKVEPEKFVGGSPARKRWLKLVLQTEVFILENGLSIDIFKKEMGIDDPRETLMMDTIENMK